ncbi:MAG: glycosyltransferase family 39 protein, partial [bacterium]
SPASFKLLSPITAARLPIAFVGTMTCLLLYLLGRSTFGDAVAFWAATLLAFYPPHVALSRVTHIDSTLTMLFTSSLLCYLIYARRSRLRWNVASAVFFGLALLTKTPAYAAILVLIIWKGMVRLHDRRRNARFWNVGDLLWLGIGFMIYFAFYTKLWIEPAETNWIKFSRFLPPAAMLARSIDLISSFPWLQLSAAFCTVFILYVAARRIMRGSDSPMCKGASPLLIGVFAALLCLTFVQIFRRPLINELLHIAKVYYTGEIGHLKYWMGQKVSTPPRWFYPFILFIQTPPLMILFTICGFVRACGTVKNRERGWDAHLMCLLAPIVLIAVMSVGRKMASRYVDPAIPFVCLIASIGFTGVIRAVSTLPSVERSPGVRRAVQVAAASCLVVSMVVPLVNVAPAYDIYCNLFIGGPAGASGIISIGPEMGKKEAVEYLKSRVRDEDSIVTAGALAEFRYYWEHEQPRPACEVLIDRTSIEYADWLVLPLGHRVRHLRNTDLRRARNPLKVYSVMKCGVDFLDVYKLDDAPVTENRSYAAADLKTKWGSLIIDKDAGNGNAVKAEGNGQRGLLIHGPNARYSKGCWRAVFRLKAAAVAADRPLCRLSVTGASEKETIRSIDLRANEFGNGDGYVEFPLDFCIDRIRRIQFCVESNAIAPVWVDGVTVLKM